MEIYLIIFAMLFIIGAISILKRSNNINSFYISVILFLFGSLRYKIGMDYESYEEIFDTISTFPNYFLKSIDVYIEPGYYILISFFKFCGFDKIGLFALHILISLYFTNKAIIKYSNNIYISWLILFGVYFANLFFNGIRQGIFISIVLYYLPALLEKTNRNIFIIFIMTFFLSFSLHKTALILPFVYFLCLYTPSFINKIIILIISMLWAFTGIGDLLVQISGISFIKETAYLSVIDLYSQSEGFGKEINFFSITVLHRLLILILALYFSNFNSASIQFKKLTSIYYWGIIIYFILVPLGYFLATRVNMNLKIFDVLIIPYILSFLKEFKFKFIFYILISLWSFAVMITNFYIPGNYDYYIPYRSIFSK